MKNETTEHKTRVTKPIAKLLTGSTSDKYPVILDGGRTIIYISDKSREAEIRERYELRRRT